MHLHSKYVLWFLLFMAWATHLLAGRAQGSVTVTHVNATGTLSASFHGRSDNTLVRSGSTSYVLWDQISNHPSPGNVVFSLAVHVDGADVANIAGWRLTWKSVDGGSLPESVPGHFSGSQTASDGMVSITVGPSDIPAWCGLYKLKLELLNSGGTNLLANEYVLDVALTLAAPDAPGFLVGESDPNGWHQTMLKTLAMWCRWTGAADEKWIRANVERSALERTAMALARNAHVHAGDKTWRYFAPNALPTQQGIPWGLGRDTNVNLGSSGSSTVLMAKQMLLANQGSVTESVVDGGVPHTITRDSDNRFGLCTDWVPGFARVAKLAGITGLSESLAYAETVSIGPMSINRQFLLGKRVCDESGLQSATRLNGFGRLEPSLPPATSNHGGLVMGNVWSAENSPSQETAGTDRATAIWNNEYAADHQMFLSHSVLRLPIGSTHYRYLDPSFGGTWSTFSTSSNKPPYFTAKEEPAALSGETPDYGQYGSRSKAYFFGGLAEVERIDLGIDVSDANVLPFRAWDITWRRPEDLSFTHPERASATAASATGLCGTPSLWFKDGVMDLALTITNATSTLQNYRVYAVLVADDSLIAVGHPGISPGDGGYSVVQGFAHTGTALPANGSVTVHLYFRRAEIEANLTSAADCTVLYSVAGPYGILNPIDTEGPDWLFSLGPNGMPYDAGEIRLGTRSAASPWACCLADVGVQGGVAGSDCLVNNNDMAVYIELFNNQHCLADVGVQGGTPGNDMLFNNNDWIVFVDYYFQGCPD